MNKNYVIQWRSKVNGRAGRGTKPFEKTEAQKLVEELNREYPQITHEAVEITTTEPGQEEAEERTESVSAAVLSIA